MDGTQRCHFMMAHKGRDHTICLLIACCQRASTLQRSGSFINPTSWHGWDRSTLLVPTYTLCISKPAKDANKSSGCHVGTEASSFRVGVCVCKRKCTYVCERESRTLFACPCDGFQPCLIMFAFKLGFMLFGTSFATSRESYAFIEVSLMFSCCLFASDAMLVKRHMFHVHQSLLLQHDRRPPALGSGNSRLQSWFCAAE